MNVLSLNCWGARIAPQIFDFIASHRHDTDVFCFQEVMRDTGEKEFDPMLDPTETRTMVEKFSQLLPEFEYRFANFYGADYCVATFVRSSIGIVQSTEPFVYLSNTRIWPSPGNEGAHARKLLVTTLGNGFHVANLHGLWIKGYGKGDHEDRIIQSERILAELAPLKGPKILIGDFNLEPDTESLKMIENAGFTNLIRKYGILSTRTSLYPHAVKFADYALVTHDVSVADFRVLSDEVSDHAPLLLKIHA
jgi:endonuclease/exonuclease/phosphatase family metal-dependent hydrolase